MKKIVFAQIHYDNEHSYMDVISMLVTQIISETGVESVNLNTLQNSIDSFKIDGDAIDIDIDLGSGYVSGFLKSLKQGDL